MLPGLLRVNEHLWRLAGLLVIISCCNFAKAEIDQSAAALLKEAERLFWLDNWAKARPLFAKLEQHYARAGDKRNTLYARFSRLRADGETSLSYPEVSRYIAEQLRTPVVQNDLRLKLRALIVKGAADLSTRDPVSSGREFMEALATSRKLGDRGWEGRATGELSVVAFLKGDHVNATKMNQLAYEMASAANDPAGQVRARSLKGVGLLEQGKLDDALVCFDEALEIAARTPDLRFPLMAYMGKAQALDRRGLSKESQALLSEAQRYVEAANMSVYKADLLIALGHKARRIGDVGTAKTLFEQGAEAAKKASMPRPYADAQFQLAELLAKSGDLVSAEVKVHKGLKASRALVDMYVLPQKLAAAADIAARLQKYPKAVALYEEASDLIDSLLLNAPSASVKSSLIATMTSVYAGYFQVALKAERNIPRAYEILEQARGRVLADRLRARPYWQAEQPSATPGEKRIASIQKRLLRSQTIQERKQLIRELNSAEMALTPVLLSRAQRITTPNGKPASLAALQRTLRADELLLEYVIDDPETTCLGITNNSVNVYRLPGKGHLEKLIDEYIKETKDTRPAPAMSKTASRTLYDVLLQPLKEYAVKPRLVVIPDGKLNLVRFDSLVSPEGKYVVESHITTYSPSGTVLSLLRKHRPALAPLPLLAFGTASTTKESLQVAEAVRLRGVFDLQGASFSPLPSAATEVYSIAEFTPGRARIFLSNTATEEALKSQPLSKFRVLHFAAHAFTDSAFPERSAIVLAANDRSPDDGLLQMREIRDLRLTAALVTLSACDSGVGKINGIEGMASLVNAFLFAGAQAVVASSWAADDDFTASLMKRFYTHLSRNQDVGLSLRQAKLDMIRRLGDKAAPLYWAGFFVTGDASQTVSLNP